MTYLMSRGGSEWPLLAFLAGSGPNAGPADVAGQD